MPDTATVRKRRERAHKAGDHAQCRPEWCPEAPRANRAGAAGELEAAVVAYLNRLELADDDPRALVGMVAVRLARSMDTRMSAAVARELRGCLDRLAGRGGEAGDEFDPRAVELLRGLRELVR